MRDPLNLALVVVAALLLVVGGRFAYERWQDRIAAEATVQGQRLASHEKRVSLAVDGMMCANCVETITNALQSTPGVITCDVDKDQGRAVVVCERSVADTTLVGVIARSGADFSCSLEDR